jgi:hypothetical protein
MNDQDFLVGMKNFVDVWCAESDHRKRAEENVRQAEREIIWIQNRIQELELLRLRRPSVQTQIRDLKRQIREREVKIAFDDSYDPNLHRKESI